MSQVSPKSFKPRKLKLVASKKKLTNAAGLGLMIEHFDSSALSNEFFNCLPERKSNRSMGSYRLGLTQLASFMYGHDCIDDIIEFRVDPLLKEVMRGETVLPRTMGNYLRDFKVKNIKDLNKLLSTQSQANRKIIQQAHPGYFDKPIHLSVDSTPHEQSGKKMEGLSYNYKDMWCLDTQSIFDREGFCHGMQLREGSAKSGRDAEKLIKQAFKKYKHSDLKYLSADSAYCNQTIIKTCLSDGVKFTIVANQATTSWRNEIKNITKWEKWQYTEKELKKAKEKNIKLPDVDLGVILWRPSWNDVLRLPIVVKRQALEQADLEGGYYKYYGIVTNHNLAMQSLQSLVEHYNKRGNVENFIREEKYGYDLKHFPCQKLRANYAFGLIAIVAMNHMRMMALVDRPVKTNYAKKFRRKFIHIPGYLVKHARQTVLKIPQHYLKEVNRLKEGLQLPGKNSAYPAGCSSG